MHALVTGMRWGFGVGAALAVVVVVLAFVMPGRLSPEQEAATEGMGAAH